VVILHPLTVLDAFFNLNPSLKLMCGVLDESIAKEVYVHPPVSTIC
jgi:hypothetical protein